MPSEKKELSKNRVKLTVSVPAEKMSEHFEAEYQKIAPTITVPGFRPGKAPKTMTIEAIGQNRLVQQATESAISEAYRKALVEYKVLPVTAPAISISKYPAFTQDKSQNELIFEVEFDILPEAKIGNWKKIKVKKIDPKDLEVKDEEVDKVLEYLRRQAAQLKDVERVAKAGDWVQISFTGSIKNVVKEKLTSKSFPLILGETQFIPGFAEKIEGAKKGDKKSFELKLPQEIPDKDLAGHSAKFEVEVEAVKEIVLPKVDAEFMGRFGHKSIGELKGAIRASLEQEKSGRERRRQEMEIGEQIIKLTKVEIPPSLIQQEKERVNNLLQNDLQSRKVTYEKYLENVQMTPEKMEENLIEQARRNIIIGVGLGEIAKQEKIELTPQDGARRVYERIIEVCAK